MKLYHGFAIILFVFSIGCNKGDDNNTAASTLDGNQYFTVTNVLGGSRLNIIKFSGNKMQTFISFIPLDQSKVIYRKETANYSSSGTNYKLDYTYSTCYGLGSEDVEITGDPADTIGFRFKSSSTTILYKNWKKYYVTGLDENRIQAGIEDKACNLLSQKIDMNDVKLLVSDKRLNEKSGRLPASETNK